MPYNFVPDKTVTAEALRAKIYRKSADRQTEFSSQYRVCITCRAVKTISL